MTKKQDRLIVDLGILFGAFWVVLGLNYYWLSLDPSLPGGDTASLLTFSLEFAEKLFHQLNLSGAFFSTIDYPPLPFCYITVVYWIFGMSQQSAYLGTGLWLAILLPAMYFLGLRLGNRLTGILAALLCAFSPQVLFCSKAFLPDLPLLALTAISLYWLVMSEDFSISKYTIYFALTAGLAMLTKVSFIFFILGPLIISAGRVIWGQKSNRAGRLALLLVFLLVMAGDIRLFSLADISNWVRGHFYLFMALYWAFVLGCWMTARPWLKNQPRAFGNLTAGIFIALAIIGPWYLGALREMFLKADLHFLGWYQAVGLTWGQVWLSFLGILQGLFPWGILLPLLGLVLLRDRKFAGFLFSGLALGFGLTVLSVGYNPYPRYLLPLLPYLALLAVLWLAGTTRVWRILFTCLISLALVWQLGGWVLAYHFDFPDRILGISTTLSPQPCGKQYYQIAEDLYRELQKWSKGKKVVLLVSETINPGDPAFDALNFWARRDNWPLMVDEEPEISFNSIEKLRNCDFVVFYPQNFKSVASIQKLMSRKYHAEMQLWKTYNYYKSERNNEIRLYKINWVN